MFLLGVAFAVATSGLLASRMAGAEAVEARLSDFLAGDDVVAITPIVAELSTGGVPILALIVAALACGLIVRSAGMDPGSTLAAVAAAIVVELMVALSFRGLAPDSEIGTLIVPMLAAAVLVAVLTGAVLSLTNNRPTAAQLLTPRRVTALVVLVAMLVVTAFVDTTWPPVVNAVLAIVALLLWRPLSAHPAERPLCVAILCGALLLLSIMSIAREHLWDAIVLTAVIALGLVTFWLARADGAWAARAVCVAAVAVGVGSLAAVAAAHEDPTPVRAVVALTTDNELSCGIHIATVGNSEVYVNIGAGKRDVTWIPHDELVAYEHEDAARGEWRTVARELARDVMDGRRMRRATTADEFCQPDRPAAPTPTEALPVAQRFQPDLILSDTDGFWPVSVLTTYGLRDRGRDTCVEARRPTLRCGLDDGLPWSGGDGHWLEYPSHDRDTARQGRAMTDILGSRDPDRSAIQYYLASRGRGGTWNVQYWSFYVFNYQEDVLGGYHEGDFELTGVVLSASRRPRYVWMSRHKPFEGRPFAFGEQVLGRQNHIDLHVARGSHAVYETCGRQRRPGLPPDDHTACENRYQLRPQLRDLALAPWACWRGRFGHRSWTAGDVLGEGPQSPLWQQTFDDRPAEPCEVVAEDPGRPKDADEAEPDAAADELRKAAGRLEWLFDECSDWEKPPATGTYLVACDQASLGDFFDSGLDDEKAATVQITGLGFEAAAPMVPAVWRAPDVQNFEKPVIRATPRASLQIYAVCPAADGRQVEASFEDVRLRAGGTATIDDSNPSRWRLLGTDGKGVAWDTPNRIDYARTDGRPARGPEISARCQR